VKLIIIWCCIEILLKTIEVKIAGFCRMLDLVEIDLPIS
jgi:hypothetical protein